MTVFEPTTPHRTRLVKVIHGVTTKDFGGYSLRDAEAVADALIEAGVVADPEWVAVVEADAKAMRIARNEYRAAVAAGRALAERLELAESLNPTRARLDLIAADLRAALAAVTDPSSNSREIADQHKHATETFDDGCPLVFADDGCTPEHSPSTNPRCNYAPTAVTDPRADTEARIREQIAALRTLVELKDGPRDQHYFDTKEQAWADARSALGVTDLDDEEKP